MPNKQLINQEEKKELQRKSQFKNTESERKRRLRLKIEANNGNKQAIDKITKRNQQMKKSYARYYSENKEKRKSYYSQYYSENKDKLEKYRAENRKKSKEYAKKYRAENKEKINESARERYFANKNRILDKQIQKEIFFDFSKDIKDFNNHYCDASNTTEKVFSM